VKTKPAGSKLFFLLVALFSCACSYAQFNIGAFYSTFNLRAVNLKAPGFGITAEYEANEKVVYALSFAYNTKVVPADSSEYTFLHLSADFYDYLAGSADYTSKVSFYLGAGASVLQTQLKTNYQPGSYVSQKSKSITEGFEFMIGGDVKLWFFKIFLRGRANIFLKYPIPYDDQVLPLLTNTQIGFLIPLSGQNKIH
jgi:outer membrane protein with beta-barrel domain